MAAFTKSWRREYAEDRGETTRILPSLNVKTARLWRGIFPPYAPRTGGAYDSHHRTAGIAGCTRRGGGVAARGTRAAGGEDTPHRNCSPLGLHLRNERNRGPSILSRTVQRAAPAWVCRGKKSGGGAIFGRGTRGPLSRALPRRGGHKAGCYRYIRLPPRSEFQSGDTHDPSRCEHGRPRSLWHCDQPRTAGRQHHWG